MGCFTLYILRFALRRWGLGAIAAYARPGALRAGLPSFARAATAFARFGLSVLPTPPDDRAAGPATLLAWWRFRRLWLLVFSFHCCVLSCLSGDGSRFRRARTATSGSHRAGARPSSCARGAATSCHDTRRIPTCESCRPRLECSTPPRFDTPCRLPFCL